MILSDPFPGIDRHKPKDEGFPISLKDPVDLPGRGPD
jgi:hypothetical protein